MCSIALAKRISAPPEPLPQLWCVLFEISVSSLYKATENELQGSWMAISKTVDQVPQSHLFRKNRLPSDFNIQAEGVDVEV
jgi:hypothetical protein